MFSSFCYWRNVSAYRARTRAAHRLVMHTPPLLTRPPNLPILNTTMGIKEALDAIAALKLGEHFSYSQLAKNHSCCRSTLSRRHRGISASNQVKANDQLLLNPRDEAEVVKYIQGLTERHLMPTRQIIINIVSHGWVRGLQV